MESALQRKAATHDHEIQRLYEEMEQQIKSEKDRIALQDHERFLSRSQDLELQLCGKEAELEQLVHKQKRLELQCRELHSEQHVTKVENVKLKHKNDELARELDHTGQELSLAQDHLNDLQEESTRLHEEKEMYRSITKQFFRKADGVVVMYDITTVQSFTAVRQWLTSVKEGAGDDIPTLLLGNKLDKEAERQVEKGVGERLAKDCQMTFYECSACSGHNVTEAMIHLARILKEQEDREKEKTVQLLGGPSERKRSCC
ncbi:EF-hand calcium-binding domain-containing protein 4B [Liparis tanakae]|uniref:EF-hand calcium-binding domain-containing protein 4B n=1 Tax=Liparis tanakae TaxID=230148 RepID=A0A4Z2EHW6_9TELE|nr:EF-hand calcium-binding domain-containing protein 4B [Liparis tanakae]